MNEAMMDDDSLPALAETGADAGRRAADFSASEMFRKLFQEGMELVEETANYLDGPGREDSKLLDRPGALAYATESMKLTTRLMQAASWLLAQRSVVEGEMQAEETADPKYRLPEDDVASAGWPEGAAPPAKLTDLETRSKALYARLKRIDDSLFAAAPEDGEANPVEDQLNRLKTAFGEG